MQLLESDFDREIKKLKDSKLTITQTNIRAIGIPTMTEEAYIVGEEFT